MEIVSENLDCKNNNFLTGSSLLEERNEKQSLKGGKNDTVIYSLNPLLNESLNNLVKRFERTKIPKPPLTKGAHGIRRKSARMYHCSSLPNIFLPSAFDNNIHGNNDISDNHNNESKYFNASHKKVQWTNKLNLDLEKMKSFFRENYTHWCSTRNKQKNRSMSLSVVGNTDESMGQGDLHENPLKDNVDFVCRRSSDDKNMTIKFTKCDPKSSIDNEELEEPTQTKANAGNNRNESDRSDIGRSNAHGNSLPIDSTESGDNQNYSTHLYLDGAIIEPISPASPPRSCGDNVMLKELSDQIDGDDNRSRLQEALETSAMDSAVPPKNKRGRKPRKKKSQTVTSKKSKSSLADNCPPGGLKGESISESMEALNLDLASADPNDIPVIHLPSGLEIINLVDLTKPAMSQQQQQQQEVKSSPDQTNDLEILSKSITNSVDTSMLPPRKRYKRLMYLENNKATPSSPKELPVTENPAVPDSDVIDLQSGSSNKAEIKSGEDKLLSKLTIPRSRSKRKKKTVSSTNKSSSSVERKPPASLKLATDISLEPMECDPDVMDNEEEPIEQKEHKDSIRDIVLIMEKPEKNAKEDVMKPNDVPEGKEQEILQEGSVKDRAKSNNGSSSIKARDVSVKEDLVKDNKIKDKAGKENNNNNRMKTTNKTTVREAAMSRNKETKEDLVKDIVNKEKEEDSVKIDLETRSLLKETIADKVESITKPESLKRSKREAAARGFANMVAMSLNSSNSSQSQDNSMAEQKPNPLAKKLNSSTKTATPVTTAAAASDSNEIPAPPEPSIGKIFKRPRKSNATETTGPTKSKVKRATSPVGGSNEPEPDNIAEAIKSKEPEHHVDKDDKPKPSKKIKRKNMPEEAPPSPNETIISNDSLNYDHTKFRRIRTNTYIDPKPLYWFQEVERCGCKSSKLRGLYDQSEVTTKPPIGKGKSIKKRIGPVWDCGDNCLNRLTYTECQAKNCQCGDTCGNQKIRKGEWAPGLKIVDFPGKGKGVITAKPIREGTFIIEYVGEVINEHTFQDRMMNVYRDDSHHYCLHLDGDMLIDAYRSGSLARFVNHSCQPNCEMQKWMVNGAYRMCLFAIEDIPADAELYYDYNFCSFNTKNTQICLCGSACCRGFIGSKPRAEQTESQKDRKKLLYIFGRLLSSREKLFILRTSIFLLRNRELGRCQRLGIRKPQVSHGNRLPSTISEIKRRKAKKNQFLTQMSALNSIRSIKTRQLQNAQDNEHVTRAAQLGQVLKDLYNTLLEQKDPLNANQQLVAPFIHGLNRKKYAEFYRMIGQDSVASLSQVYTRLLDGIYTTMMAFDQDILQMLHNVEFYAGKQSNIGQCSERMKPIYRELKMNSIALYEALTDEVFDEKDKQKLISNNLQLITSALAAIRSHLQPPSDMEQQSVESTATAAGVQKNKKRKHAASGTTVGARGRLERGAEVIKCICGFLIEAGHVMVQCDRCFVWQHAYCMNVARSSELADVTRMEPYYCHICLNIPTESLIREIPRHFVISDETIGSDNTLFWTLLHGSNLFKIDDFVYIANDDCGGDKKPPVVPPAKSKQSSKPSPTAVSMMPVDLSRRTIMRIYSLWKDGNGRRWMEGGLFLRPYDNQLQALINRDVTKLVGSNKRKSSSSPIDLNTHKWHQYEVVYTDFTRILPLDNCLGRCVVLNSYTFRHGKPLLQNTAQNSSLDVFVCDWMINQHSEWSELDPTYLKINTKPYCFERFQDSSTNETSSSNERFCRQYLTEDLLQMDKGFMPSIESFSPKVSNKILSNEERVTLKMHSLKKLLNKLVDFAYERNQKLPLSSTPSSVSGSTSSSRGASPLCENSGSKSPLRPLVEVITHGPRKSLLPRKYVKKDDIQATVVSAAASSEPGDTHGQWNAMSNNETMETNKEGTLVPSDASDISPQLMIVVDEFQQAPRADSSVIGGVGGGLDDSSKAAIVEKCSSTDEKDTEEKTVSSVKETVDDQSNFGSEINFGDFVNLLKNTEAEPEKEKSAKLVKPKPNRIGASKVTKRSSQKKPKKKIQVKKNELKPVSEITPAEDEWVPVATVMKPSSNNRPRTRSRKSVMEPGNEDSDKCNESTSSNNNNGGSSSNTEVELILTGLNIKGIFTSNENATVPAQPDSAADIANLPSKSAEAAVATSSNMRTFTCTKPIDDDDDESTKSCFVKLERLKMKQKKERTILQSGNNSAGGAGCDNKGISKPPTGSAKIDDIARGKAAVKDSPWGSATPDNISKLHSSDDNGAATAVSGVSIDVDNVTMDTVAKQSSCKSKSNSSGSSSQSDSASAIVQLTNQMATCSSKSFPSEYNDNDSKQEAKNANLDLSLSIGNRSKRKKGVPKRIPFDFSYPHINAIKPLIPLPTTTGTNDATAFVDEIVDLSSSKPSVSSDAPDHPIVFNTQKIDTPDSSVPVAVLCTSKKFDSTTITIETANNTIAPILNVTENRHITAANDFSSIENISSN